jgi:hypothetical protein
MVSCLVGDPENGKSTIYQWLAAKITSQEPTYFRDEKIPHGSVLFCNAEEVMGITTKPRLIENGADVDKIYQIESVNVKQKVDGEMQIVQIDMTIEKAVSICGKCWNDTPIANSWCSTLSPRFMVVSIIIVNQRFVRQ